jgi:thymidylate synthase
MQAIEQVGYLPKHKPNQLVIGTGRVAVITGWTVKSAISSLLEPSEYAAIGNLFSATRGLSPLIRNLLLNPQVRHLVALSATKEDAASGSIQCLLDFFRYGFVKGKNDVDKPCWVINSQIPGYLDIEIEENVLEALRQSVFVREASSIESAVAQVKSITEADTIISPWGEPMDFPQTEFVPKVLPGHLYSHRIEADTVADGWILLLHRILTTGCSRPTGYDGYWQELINLQMVITDEPEEFYIPNHFPCDQKSVDNYVHEQFLYDAPYQKGSKYSYGQRMRSWFGKDQIEQCIQKLIGEIDAASAVINFWDSGGVPHYEWHPDAGRVNDSSDHEYGGSPCINHLWFRVVNNELSLTATIRSNDMFSAWPTNAFGLRALQQYVRDLIAERSDYDLLMGPLITNSQSAHLYGDSLESAQELVKKYYRKILRKYLNRHNDPVGNYVVEKFLDEVVVTRTTPGVGDEVASYRGKHFEPLADAIFADAPGMQPRHAMHIGFELGRALR